MWVIISFSCFKCSRLRSSAPNFSDYRVRFKVRARVSVRVKVVLRVRVRVIVRVRVRVRVRAIVGWTMIGSRG